MCREDRKGGIVVAFALAESNAAGFHFHALTEDQNAGGHVLDRETANVTVELDTIDSWLVELPAR